jgi:nicotinate-nucleotide pyrophosphorylase (carboxylating)
LFDSRLSRIVEEAILEDLGMGDITTDSIISPTLRGVGEIVAKEGGILAGSAVAALVFQLVDEQVAFTASIAEGARVERGHTIARIEGPFASLLKGERTALNILQRMSGIATLTALFVEAVRGTRARITDTRKTPPGLRLLDKLAVRTGGGVNHRFGLDDMILIKDNHIAAAGGIGPALERCLAAPRPPQMRIEVETKNLAEVSEALHFHGIHRIMLDNFSLPLMAEAVNLIARAVEVEASGNVSLETVRAVAETGVDFISVGALTHSPRALDVSMNIRTA